jgi:SAM-dependent methyltransferase
MGAQAKTEYEQAAMFLHAAMREIAGLTEPSQARVLDFGTGAGKLVEHLFALGYDMRGCDTGTYWPEATPAQAERLSVIGSAPYRLPYADTSFDAVVSTSVLEHARNKEEVFREIHRVLKVGGCALHLFPAKWYLPVEPHTYVPLLNALWPHCPGWWLSLWAFLGVRNEFQRGRPWREVARLNAEYSEQGLSYWSDRAYRELSLRVFGNYSDSMDLYVRQGYGGVARLLRQLPLPRLTGRMAGAVRMKFITVRKLEMTLPPHDPTLPA